MVSRGIPETQRAIQLTGRNELRLNTAKPVVAPGPHQMLCRVEAVGLCFSDLKLLKDFSGHSRKSAVVSGVDPDILADIPSYVPGEAPTVPGHEAVVRVCAVGEAVRSCSPGDRRLVQADYRWLLTEQSNAAFGYNFEGALQEYVLLDERVIMSPEGDCALLPAPEEPAASALALVEPWACVEASYAVRERCTLKAGGKMLVAADVEPPSGVLSKLLREQARPAEMTWLGPTPAPRDLPVRAQRVVSHDRLAEGAYDDVVYFGARPEMLEALFPKLAARGLLNLALCGGHLNRPVAVPVGRVHYGGIRIVGTAGPDPMRSMKAIPESGEIRRGDKVGVVGAGGPMGVMHVLRAIYQAVDGAHLFAGDVNEERLAGLKRIAGPLAARKGVAFRTYNPSREQVDQAFDYIILMVPSAALVAETAQSAAEGAIINIFAGMPVEVTAEIDLNAYIDKRLYFIGTSGSRVDDMRAVLGKLASGRLDTNLSVSAVSGLDGVAAGIRAVEDRTTAGKIIVYPACRGLGLTQLAELGGRMPAAAACLENGMWNQQAEAALLRACTH